MQLTFLPVIEKEAHAIFTWRYPAPYDLYNIEADSAALQYVLDPANQFFGIHAEDQLAGFCSFGQDGQVPGGDYSQPALDIGLGLRPDLTGQGLGAVYIAAVLDFARERYAPPNFRVTIADFNQRARRVWEHNGFKYQANFQHTGSGREFVLLTRSAG